VEKLVAGMDHEAKVRTDPELSAQRLVKIWNGLEERQKALSGWSHDQERAPVEEQLQNLTRSLKENPQLEQHMRARQEALGIEVGSRLEQVLKERNLERALDLSVRGHEQERDLGLSL